MLMPSTPFQRARRTLSMKAARPTLLKPKRLMIAWRAGRRKRRGRGLPGCARGVTVPTSKKTKAQGAKRVDMLGVFVQAGGKADRVGEFEAERSHRRARYARRDERRQARGAQGE